MCELAKLHGNNVWQRLLGLCCYVCSLPSYAVRMSLELEMQAVLLGLQLHMRRLGLPALLQCISPQTDQHMPQSAGHVVLKFSLLCCAGDRFLLRRLVLWLHAAKYGGAQMG